MTFEITVLTAVFSACAYLLITLGMMLIALEDHED